MKQNVISPRMGNNRREVIPAFRFCGHNRIVEIIYKYVAWPGMVRFIYPSYSKTLPFETLLYPERGYTRYLKHRHLLHNDVQNMA